MKKYKYKVVRVHNHPFFPGKSVQVYEHRLVMAEHLGRPLLRTEDVHHKDEDRTDNQINNLEIKIHGKHIAYHKIGSVHSVKTRRKISFAKKGKPGYWLGKYHTIEAKKKMSLAKIGKPGPMGFKGKRHTAETKKKMSTSHKGKHHTSRAKRKMSAIRRKYWLHRRLYGT